MILPDVLYELALDFCNYSGALMELDLSSIKPCLSGPKRPHDRVELSNMKADFNACLSNPVGFKGFNIPAAKHS